ncbi:MAG: thiamine phosphate synthase [Caulobacteraceae bacterium]
MSEASRLWRAARRLNRLAARRKGLPPLLLFTDPERTPDPLAAASRLPRGAGVVYRAFGAPGAVEVGRALARLCRRRGLGLLVGADVRLAARLGADGVHLPERMSGRAGDIRALRRRFLVTAAAHSLPAVLRARRAGADALVISPIFVSGSPSAGAPLGPLVLARWVRRAGASAYALGGVNGGNVGKLGMTGAVGVAAIEALVRT